MSVTIPLSMTQQFDIYGAPLDGGKLYFIVAGTVSTPQNAFQDTALTLPWPNPITLDATGRVPQLFFADGLIKIRLTDKHGVTQLVADNVQVIGASSGGGGGGAIDPTTIYQTGDLKPRYSVGAHTGWVRANGNTIGSATSGASERANADTQALFQYLWGTDGNLAVSGGRGASSLADFTANKTITLPDWRGRVIAGLSDMGAADSGRLTAAYFGTSPIVLGAAGGEQSHLMATNEVGPHLHNAFIVDPGHLHTIGFVNAAATPANGVTGGSNNTIVQPTASNTSTASTGIRITGTSGGAASDLTGLNIGGSVPHNNTQPTLLATIYIKL